MKIHIRVDFRAVTFTTLNTLTEETQEMRRQIKSLEDMNMSYTQQTLDLEEQLRRMKTMLSQVDVYRKKVCVGMLIVD